jgi:hypothetical protein
MRDAASKGIMSNGEGRFNRKVSATQVREMRGLHAIGWTSIDLAHHYPLSARTIRKIVTGKNWRHT